MQSEIPKDKPSKKKKDRTWVEAAKIVLEKFKQIPMSHKEILKVIEEDQLKDVSGATSLACLNSMLHSNCRGLDCVFYKVAGRTAVYGLTSEPPDGTVLSPMDEERSLSDQHVDENGWSALPSQSTAKTCRERKKETIMFATLPDNCQTIPEVDSDDDDDSPVLPPGTHKCSESMSTETSEMTGEGVAAVAPVMSTLSTTVSKPQKRRNRNNPLRHYKRRKKKAKLRRIKIKPAVSSSADESEGRATASSSSTNSKASSPSSLVMAPRSTPLRTQTLRELLATIPGFSMKPRKRTNQKLSAAAQLRQTKEGCIDLETPNSILVNTNLKAILSKYTFTQLPAHYQYTLTPLLPQCDRIMQTDGALRMGPTALHNEFFTKACVEWRERLSEGEFTPDNQQRIKHEEDKEHTRMDKWKVKHFEDVWGQKSKRKRSSCSQIDSTAAVLPPVSRTPSTRIQPPKARLVSTILRRRTISQNVAASTGSECSRRSSQPATATTTTCSEKKPPASVISSSAGEKTNPVSTSVSTVGKKVVQKQPVASPGGPSQICANNQTLLQQLKRPLEIRPTVQKVLPVKKARLEGVVTTSVTVTTPASIRQSTPSSGALPQQKKGGTMKGVVMGGASVTRLPQGHTRTLAQIKAQTKAKLHARSQKPNILICPKPKEPSTIAPADGVNLLRSHKICQEMIEKSRQSGAQSLAVATTTSTHSAPCQANIMTVPTQQLRVKSIDSNGLKMKLAPVIYTTKPSAVSTTPMLLPVSTKKPVQASTTVIINNSSGQPSSSNAVTPPVSTRVIDASTLPLVSTLPLASVPTESVSATSTASVATSDSTNRQPVKVLWVNRSGADRTCLMLSTNSNGNGILRIPSRPNSVLTVRSEVQGPPRANSAPPINLPPHRIIKTIYIKRMNRPDSTGTPTSDASPSANKISLSSSHPSLQRLLSQKDLKGNLPDASPLPHAGLQPHLNQLLSTSLSNGQLVMGASQVVLPQNGIQQTLPGGYHSQGVLVHTPVPAAQAAPVAQYPQTILTSNVPSSNPSVGDVAAIHALGTTTEQSNCACNLKAMVMCQKCGAFCHDECIGPSKLCVTCLITT